MRAQANDGEAGHSADVVVIGGGLAGLCAAAHVARSGKSVTLVEKSGSLGGRGATQHRNGFALNQGAHALYRAGAGARILAELGVPVPGKAPDAAGGYAIDAGSKHMFPGGFLSLLSTGLLPWTAKIEVARLLGTLPRLDTKPYDSVSVADALPKLARHPDVQRLLGALIRLSTYGNDPTRQSAGAALFQLKLALAKNVTYVDGGWQTLVDGLRRVAEQAGARIVSGERAERVVESASGAEVHLADGGVLRCDAVILATPPDEAARIADGNARSVLERWAAESIPMLASCLDVCLERIPLPNARFALGIDRPVYLSMHSAVAKLAPEGQGLIHLLKYLGAGPSEDAQADERELESVLDLIQPGWRQATAHKRFLPRMVVSHGLVSAKRGGLAGRPGPEVPGSPRLFVAGDWVGPEGMLADASLASGSQAARLASTRGVAAARAA